jgi:hypothetical protein
LAEQPLLGFSTQHDDRLAVGSQSFHFGCSTTPSMTGTIAEFDTQAKLCSPF